jgi:hypothetical protein
MGVLLSKYVDNEATPEERRRVEEHLGRCAACKELLSIFMRNESMLGNSLTRESYGEEIVDRVMDRIDEPPEAEPAEETRWERFGSFLRERPWIQLAAAALFMVATIVIVMASHSARDNELRREVADLKQKVLDQDLVLREERENEQHRTQAMLDRMRDLHGDLLQARMAGAGRDIPGNSNSVAYFYDGVAVCARFSGKERFVSYTVWRSDDGGKGYAKLREGLNEPEYVDTTVEPGHEYWYKFTARRANLESVESVPVRIVPPLRGGLDPRKCFSIRCTEIGVNNDVATFAVTRYVNQAPVTYHFTVRLGQPLGRPVQTPAGEVDFATGFELDSIEMGDETLKVTFAWPKYDDQMNPIEIAPGQQAYDLRDHILSIRSNSRAVLRPSTSPSGKNVQKVWRDGELLIAIGEK